MQTAQTSGTNLVQYDEANELKVQDRYQWKISLTKRGFWSPSTSDFVTVKAKPSSAVCSLVLPNGIRLEFQGALSPDLIRTIVSGASPLS